MKKLNYKKTLAIGLSITIFLPLAAIAAGLIPSDADINGTATTAGKGLCSLTILINNAITWFLDLSATVAAITFSIAGGKMLMNPENPGEREKAMEMFKKTVIGMVIILIAWLVVHTIIVSLVGTGSGALRFLDASCS